MLEKPMEASEGRRIFRQFKGLRCLTPKTAPIDRKGLFSSVPHAALLALCLAGC